MSQSMQHNLSRVRPPRVQITYDVETGGAIERKELAFIVGILADLSGSKPATELPPVIERKFVQIDRDNFDEVMDKVSPHVAFSVEDAVADVTFSNIEDFHPVNVIKKIPDLNAKFEIRNRLRDFIAKTDGNEPLSRLLARVIPMAYTRDPSHSDDEHEAAQKEAGEANKVANTKAKALGDELTEIVSNVQELLKEVDEELAGTDIQNVELSKLQEIDQKAFNNAIGPVNKESEEDQFVKRMLAVAEAGGVGMVLEPSQKYYALQLIAEFVATINPAGVANNNSKTSPQLMQEKIANLDEEMGHQLNLIMHHEDFQTMEATWRGLHYLVMKSETGEKLKLKVMNISKKELLKDLQKAVDFDQSALFKKVYEEEYGTYGGAPYSMLLAAYEFGRHPQDIELLNLLSGVAATAHTPVVASAYAKLFDMEDFSELSKPRDLTKLFDSAELQKWKEFRETEDSRYITLALPRVMLRLPYGDDFVPVEEMAFEEDVNGSEATKYLWGNAAFILTERITNAFAQYGWTAAIRGVEGGGLVEGLPIHTVKTRDGDQTVYCPTQIAITDRREKELNELGFMAICHCKGTGKAAFFGGQSTNKPKKYIEHAANANASISAMLPYMLNASRFAHYIKVMMREKVGSFQTRAAIENFLNNWITQYVLLDESAGQESKAAFPLQQGRVIVTEVQGKPGSYKSTVFLRPHFQLEELTASIRLVAEIPA